MSEDATKTCPACAEEIKQRALVCYHCGAQFDVVEHGYCAHCHEVTEAHEGRCANCDGELIDVTVTSRPKVPVMAPVGVPPPPPPGTGTPAPPPPFAAGPPPAPQASQPAAPWTPPPPVGAPPAPAWQPAPSATPTAPPRSSGRALAWVFGVLLLLFGVAGLGLAMAADSSNEDTYTAEYAALGDRDAEATASALDARVTETKRAYDAYIVASNDVYTTHEAVTDRANELVAAHNSGNYAGEQAARAGFSQAIADYTAAVEQERVTGQAYADQLALLKAEVAAR